MCIGSPLIPVCFFALWVDLTDQSKSTVHLSFDQLPKWQVLYCTYIVKSMSWWMSYICKETCFSVTPKILIWTQSCDFRYPAPARLTCTCLKKYSFRIMAANWCPWLTSRSPLSLRGIRRLMHILSAPKQWWIIWRSLGKFFYLFIRSWSWQQHRTIPINKRPNQTRWRCWETKHDGFHSQLVTQFD